MNQILYYESKKSKKNGPALDINKVILIFAITLIVFGFAFVGKGTFAVVRNSEYSKKMQNSVPELQITENGSNIIITASNVIAIDQLKYSWNDDEETVIEGNNRTYITENIDLPYGTNNNLNVVVIGTNGKSKEYTQSFSSSIGKDIKKPNIDIGITGNYLKLTITDDLALSYITYRWNDEEEKRVEPSGGENAKIEVSVEILKGRNKFKIIAVDTNNNTATREETFEGRVKPTVNVWVDGDSFLIVAEHEDKIERIEYNLNGI